MPKQSRNLKIAAAVDADIVRQLRNSKPVIDRARCDADVVQAIESLFGAVHLVPVGENLGRTLDVLNGIKPDLVFNLALSASRLEASFAGFLDLLKIAYTGSGPLGIALANDKVRSRNLLRSAGLRVPRFVELPIGASNPKIELTPPMIVKPAQLGCCSYGIYRDSLVESRKAAVACAKRVWRRFNVPAVCDEFIVGREFRVGVVEVDRQPRFEIVSISECLFPNSNSGWGFKTEGIRLNPRVRRVSGVRSVVARLPKGLTSELRMTATAAAQVLGLRGYATLDVRLADDGRSTIIEVNANPGLSRKSLIWSRPTFTENIRRIVDAALNSQTSSTSGG